MSPFFTFDNNLVDMGIMAIMSGAEYKVYSCLKRRRNEKTGECYPSYTCIQKDTGLSRPMVAKAIRSLSGVKLISIVRNKNRNSNTYSVSAVPDWLNYLTSKETKLVKKLNHTSKETELVLVKKLNSKYTNITKLKNKTKEDSSEQKNLCSEPTSEFPGKDDISDIENSAQPDIGKNPNVSNSASAAIEIPEELKGLELYEKDLRLCKQWGGLLASWKLAYPYLDIMAEVLKAHAWEISNPSRRKKNRSKFLCTWLSNAQDKGGSNGGSGGNGKYGNRYNQNGQREFNPPKSVLPDCL